MTLIELMVVVIILTILTTIAVAGYRKLIYRSRNAEAHEFLGAIRSAQNLYYQAFGQYAGSNDWAEHPAGEFPYISRVNWEEPNDPTWQHLGVRPNGPVWFKYRIRASDNPGAAPANVFRPLPVGPWFQAQARGDFDHDGQFSLYEVTSAKGDVFVQNQNE